MLSQAKLGTDTTTTRYIVPAEHMNAYRDMTTRYELDPIDIRDCNGRALPMGSAAEQAVGGSLCLLTFQVFCFRSLISVAIHNVLHRSDITISNPSREIPSMLP